MLFMQNNLKNYKVQISSFVFACRFKNPAITIFKLILQEVVIIFICINQILFLFLFFVKFKLKKKFYLSSKNDMM